LSIHEKNVIILTTSQSVVNACRNSRIWYRNGIPRKTLKLQNFLSNSEKGLTMPFFYRISSWYLI